MQGPLERVPDEGFGQQLVRLDDQETAIGAMQRTRAQLAIIGVERPLVGLVFDAAEEVVVGRMGLEHHRGTTSDMVADDEIGLVLLAQFLAPLHVGLGVVGQLLDHRLEQIHLHGLQIGTDAGVVVVLLRQRRQERLQGLDDGVLVQRPQLIARLAPPLRQAGQLFVETFFETGDIGVKAFALGLGQLGEFGFIQRLALLHRREGDIVGIAIEGDLLFQRELFHHVQGLVVALIERTFDGVLLLLECRMLEHRRKGGQQVVDELRHVGHEGLAFTRWQFQGAGSARLFEMIQVHPVVRRGLAFGFGLEVALNEGEAAGARLAHDKDVVAGPWHRHPELQRLYRTLLAQDAAEGFELIGIGEGKLFGSERAGQLIGSEPETGRDGIVHRKSLSGMQAVSAFCDRDDNRGKASSAPRSLSAARLERATATSVGIFQWQRFLTNFSPAAN